MRQTFALVLFLLMVPLSHGQTCGYYSTGILMYNQNLLDATNHTAPAGHGVYNTGSGECIYDDASYGPDVCATSCSIDLKPFASKFETSSTLYSWILVRHVVAADQGSGSGFNPAGIQSCSALQAVEVVECGRLAIICNATVSVGYGGVGISFGPNSLWKTSAPTVLTCPSRRGYNGTPILIDTDGNGFHLSSSLKGVPTNFFGTGLIMTAWPVQGSTNGWLVLPDSNFMVSTGKQMFGNQAGYANGFLQLAQYDDNQDGRIDEQDAIYNQLYVWIDANRDGVSQPEELHPLRDTIESIFLHYTESKRVDNNGNAFRYKGTIKPLPGNHVSPVIVDVILSFGAPVTN